MEKYGRAFNHPEHLIFFKGSAGALEALQHFKEIAAEQEGATTVRGKWDGCIHKDTVLKTNQGDLTIETVINKYKEDALSITVYGRDLQSGKDQEVPIIGTSVTTGVKEWVEITLENGGTLKLTEDHEVFTTNRGWVAAGELTSDDDIAELLNTKQ
jgi:hypothetical protein